MTRVASQSNDLSGSCTRRCWLLGAGVLTAALAAVPFAWSWGQTLGCLALAVATVICLLAGTLAMVSMYRFRQPSQLFLAVGAAMTLKTGLPLIAGLAVYLCVPALAQAGLLYYLLYAYLVMWLLGLLLSVPMITQATAGSAPTSAAQVVSHG